MTTLGTWLVLIGSALAVLQSVWVIVAVGLTRATLRRGRANSDAREALIVELKAKLRTHWGDAAAEVTNYEQLPEYRSQPELDGLRTELAKLIEDRGNDDWLWTHAAVGRAKARKLRELDEVEREWLRLWTQGVPGLIGGVMALLGGLLTAWGTTH